MMLDIVLLTINNNTISTSSKIMEVNTETLLSLRLQISCVMQRAWGIRIQPFVDSVEYRKANIFKPSLIPQNTDKLWGIDSNLSLIPKNTRKRMIKIR